MPNRLLTHEEVGQMFLDSVKAASKGDVKIERAIWYDLQTSLGGFPSSPEERAHYIETGAVLPDKEAPA